MANALGTFKNSEGRITKKGLFQFGIADDIHGTTEKIVHDGDTVSLNTNLNFSTRFLGIDTPEVSLAIRKDGGGPKLDKPAWTNFFASGEWKNNFPISPALLNHLVMRFGDGTKVALNHNKHATNATNALRALINADMALAGKNKDTFKFFVIFGYEALDVYARFLCYLSADENNFTPPQRPLTYNEQQLANGMAAPFFIYPNIQPFLNIDPFDKAITKPIGFWTQINKAKRLQDARKFVSDARTAKIGIFDAAAPLILLPYELRYIARKNGKGPDRFVIDLGQSGSNVILKPEKYFKIKNYEDRLFIPKEFVPLFTTSGWVIQ